DGIEAAIKIRLLRGDYYKNLPILALSANVVTGARELFLESGMNDFVSKPIDDIELNVALSKWLPPDKILDAGISSGPEDSNDAQQDKLLESIAKVKEISVVSGLKQVGGDKKLYLDVLRQITVLMPKDIENINASVRNRNWKDYSIQMHALKTVFANIGSAFMSEWAKNLEIASNTRDVQKCLRETKYFCAEMRETYLNLTYIFARHAESVKKDEAAKKKIQLIDLDEKLMSLKAACMECDTERAETLSDELKTYTYNSKVDAEINTIIEMVKSFDYDQAAETIEIMAIIL
ncbi:MAG: hypothetical protein LBS84_00855, partial [Clostridiales bacterium]|nr:hypothetical protein [Clostridiales bacterium]